MAPSLIVISASRRKFIVLNGLAGHFAATHDANLRATKIYQGRAVNQLIMNRRG
jgi:hypothetical protein